ncbi:MAG: lipopolysaccharide heptosyltransferase II [Phycisphaerales bacterium]|nr:lipopolysaccharide heptosyltransferase II [Phycisphaerales bacterium]
MRLLPCASGPMPASILIVLPTWVGDFVMATPFLRAVRRRFPSARITLLADSNLADLIDGGTWADYVEFEHGVSVSKPKEARPGSYILSLRAARFDWAILLPNSFRSALTAWRIRAKRRIGYDRDARGLLLTDRMPVKNRLRGWRPRFAPLPLVEYYADLAEALGCDRPNDALELFRTPHADASLADKCRALGVPPHQPRIVISPGAKFGAAKCWSPQRFAETADRMIREWGATVVVTCGPGEEPIARQIRDAMTQRAYVFDEPRLSLGELKSLIADADLLLCNDAGLRHFARAFDVPVVTVFGPTHPEWTRTSFARERIVRIDVDCGPCQQRVCPLGHLKCMTGVTVDSVFSAAEELLAGGGVAARLDGVRR